MRNLLIISDSHHMNNELEEILKKYKDFFIIHCGDYCIDNKILKKYNVVYVDGNCDRFDDNLERIIELDGKKILITHGHMYNVKYSYQNLYYRAKENECDYVFFGHTHEKALFNHDGITFINPGSLKYGRTYVLVINDEIIFKEY